MVYSYLVLAYARPNQQGCLHHHYYELNILFSIVFKEMMSQGCSCFNLANTLLESSNIGGGDGVGDADEKE